MTHEGKWTIPLRKLFTPTLIFCTKYAILSYSVVTEGQYIFLQNRNLEQ